MKDPFGKTGYGRDLTTPPKIPFVGRGFKTWEK
jgi:hypothetical protein